MHRSSKVPSTALHYAGWSAFDSGVQLHAQAATATRGKEPGGLALLSKRAADQCAEPGGCSCTIKVPSSALRMLAGQLFTQGFNCMPNGHSEPYCVQQHPPAAPAVG
jgi:hypothetical protein